MYDQQSRTHSTSGRNIEADAVGQLSEADRSPPRKVALATLLTMLAGFMDAVGFIPLGHLYLSFMSGNSTHLGMSLAGAHWADAQIAAAVVGAFVIGVCTGTVLADRFSTHFLRAVLSGELLVFCIAIALISGGHQRVALVLIAVGMGMQNTLHQVVAEADIGRGFITGNLFSLGQALARLPRNRAEFGLATQNAFSWMSFITGVIMGTSVFAGLGLSTSLTIAALILASLIVVTSVRWL
jgi:uncharacterized membrane protein YoaK (UPF0700 family)